MMRVNFDKTEAQRFLEAIRSNAPLTPDGPWGWSVDDMVRLAGVLLYAIATHTPQNSATTPAANTCNATLRLPSNSTPIWQGWSRTTNSTPCTNPPSSPASKTATTAARFTPYAAFSAIG
jgi:hypothetical protein